jgi:hypothetical protein
LGQYLYGAKPLSAREFAIISVRRIVLATAVLSIVPGCFGNESTPFPPGLEPLEEVTVEPPAPASGDMYPETLAMESGELSRYDWVQARGYIDAPIEDVYAALQMPEVVTDHRAVSRHSVTLDTEPEYEHSFTLHNEIDEFITVEFDIAWRIAAVEGTEDAPDVVAATWQKTYGTTFIDLIRGSLLLHRVTDDVTELELVEHVRAASRGPEPLISYINDLYRNLVEVSHDRPLPTY